MSLLILYKSIHFYSLSGSVLQFPQKYLAAQLFSANQHTRMISDGSCDTEDWSYDAKNSALNTAINYILQDIHIENSYFQL